MGFGDVFCLVVWSSWAGCSDARCVFVFGPPSVSYVFGLLAWFLMFGCSGVAPEQTTQAYIAPFPMCVARVFAPIARMLPASACCKGILLAMFSVGIELCTYVNSTYSLLATATKIIPNL
jgi:hypothetical protein